MAERNLSGQIQPPLAPHLPKKAGWGGGASVLNITSPHVYSHSQSSSAQMVCKQSRGNVGENQTACFVSSSMQGAGLFLGCVQGIRPFSLFCLSLALVKASAYSGF